MDELDEKLVMQAASGAMRSTALAKKLNGSVSTVHFRMKRLEREKVIQRYRADVDWKKAGYSIMALVLINIDTNLLSELHRTQDELLKDLLKIKYVREGYITTGDTDLVLRVVARDTDQFKDILMHYIQTQAGIVNTKTMIVLG